MTEPHEILENIAKHLDRMAADDDTNERRFPLNESYFGGRATGYRNAAAYVRKQVEQTESDYTP